MQRVLVIGCSVAGKTTLATALHDVTGLELIHLDRQYYRPSWVPCEKQEWERRVDKLAAKKRWIMDGNYGGTRMRLTRRNFRRVDFPEYHSWFQHPEVSKWLGDIDRDWLEYILTDTSGVEYAFTHQDRLVAVAGVVLPQADHPAAAIANLAICPELFRRGVGSEVLNLLVQGNHQVDCLSWIAFVARENAAAHSLLTKNGWSRSQEVPVDDMVKYEYLA